MIIYNKYTLAEIERELGTVFFIEQFHKGKRFDITLDGHIFLHPPTGQREYLGVYLTLEAYIREEKLASLPDGVPCHHTGCLSHISHPCEVCGRVGGVREIKEQNSGNRTYNIIT